MTEAWVQRKIKEGGSSALVVLSPMEGQWNAWRQEDPGFIIQKSLQESGIFRSKGLVEKKSLCTCRCTFPGSRPLLRARLTGRRSGQ